jgi:hypothetical protein
MRRRDVQPLRSGRLPKWLVLRRVGQRGTRLRLAAAMYEEAQLRVPNCRGRHELQVQRTDGGIAFELSVKVRVGWSCLGNEVRVGSQASATFNFFGVQTAAAPGVDSVRLKRPSAWFRQLSWLMSLLADRDLIVPRSVSLTYFRAFG